MKTSIIAATWLSALAGSVLVFRLVDVSSRSASDTLIGAVPIIALILGFAMVVTVGTRLRAPL